MAFHQGIPKIPRKLFAVCTFLRFSFFSSEKWLIFLKPAVGFVDTPGIYFNRIGKINPVACIYILKYTEVGIICEKSLL